MAKAKLSKDQKRKKKLDAQRKKELNNQKAPHLWQVHGCWTSRDWLQGDRSIDGVPLVLILRDGEKFHCGMLVFDLRGRGLLYCNTSGVVNREAMEEQLQYSKDGVTSYEDELQEIDYKLLLAIVRQNLEFARLFQLAPVSQEKKLMRLMPPDLLTREDLPLNEVSLGNADGKLEWINYDGLPTLTAKQEALFLTAGGTTPEIQEMSEREAMVDAIVKEFKTLPEFKELGPAITLDDVAKQESTYEPGEFVAFLMSTLILQYDWELKDLKDRTQVLAVLVNVMPEGCCSSILPQAWNELKLFWDTLPEEFCPGTKDLREMFADEDILQQLMEKFTDFRK